MGRPASPLTQARRGDLGRLDDENFLYITGRKKAVINVGGFKVSPAEVEEVLYQMEGVLGACVVAVPHPEWGSAVIAFVVPRDGQSLSERELRRHVVARLPRYMIPARMAIIRELPRTSTGKIDRRRLAQEAASGSLG